MSATTRAKEAKRRLEQVEFAESVRTLFGALRASGLVLVLPPESQTNSVRDVVDALGEAVEHYARTQDLCAPASNLMHTYLSDHLSEYADGCFRKV
jgi:hypothetical protein